MSNRKKRRVIISSYKVALSPIAGKKVQHAKGIVYKNDAIFPKKGYKLVQETGGLIYVLREDEEDVAVYSETRMIAIGDWIIMLWCRCPGLDDSSDPCYIDDKKDTWKCDGAECCQGDGFMSHPEVGVIDIGF